MICFEGTLDAKKRKKLAKALAAASDCAFDSRAWLWGELDGNTWAYFYCGGEPFAALRDRLPVIHEAVKIREVIFGGLREESERDDWTLWSHQQTTAAKRVPRLDAKLDARMIFYFGDREVVPVEPAIDEAFEDARF